MKLDTRNFQINKLYEIQEIVDLSQHQFSVSNRIKAVSLCNVHLKCTLFDDCLLVQVHGEGVVKAECSHTFEIIDVKFYFDEDFSFSKDPSDDSNFYEKDDVFDFDPYLIALIDAAVPLNVVKKGSKLPSGGDGYRVLTEEELQKERNSSKDTRWSKLDDVILDE